MTADPVLLSVIVPTLNEAEHLPLLLDDLRGLAAQVVVVDGGSGDGTPALAESWGAEVVSSAEGRGPQLRRGAAEARGRWILFLHADCRLSTAAIAEVENFVESAPPDWFAHFGFELEGEGAFKRFIEVGQVIRERLFGLVYGDQGLLVSRSLYRQVGGHPPWAVMEDVEVVRRLAAVGRRVPLPARLTTSPRRYREEGGLAAWVRNVTLISLYRLGVPPARLARWYPPRAPDNRRMVAILAKAPVPGRVKTRLASEIGEERATAVYRLLGHRTVRRLRGGPYRLRVLYDPPDAEGRRCVAAWLGEDSLDLRPQAEGDLGARMHAAVVTALEEVDEICLVGTDLPDMDRDVVMHAFALLEAHDVVLGPSTDGGYYLVGLRHPVPELFEKMSWSNDEVLGETRARAGALGLSVGLLPPLTDVDTASDLPPDFAVGRVT